MADDPIAVLAATLAARRPARVDDPGRQLAAVAVVLAPDPDSVLLIRRADRDGDRWSGQMAFPGGKWSSGDPDLLATARRETFEELGIDLASARLLGTTDDIAPRTPSLPPLIVRPYVFASAARLALVPNEEVAAAGWVELARLVAPGTYRSFEIDSTGTRLSFPGYHLAEGVVWGMTERILTPLLAMIGLVPMDRA